MNFRPILATLTSLVTLLLTTPVAAQSELFLLDHDGNAGRLSELEAEFIQSRFDALDLGDCTRERLPSQPRVDYRRLEIRHKGQTLKLHITPDVLRTNAKLLYADTAEGAVEYVNCTDLDDSGLLLPVLALLVTADFATASETSLMRQRVLASNSGLTSHEPNRLLARTDSDDINSLFMDFKISTKHPLFPNAATINTSYDRVAETIEQFVPGDSEYFLQMYMSFTGRFSQYVNSRDSSPVVARAFNPETFFRLWGSEDNWMDFGIGHESNGQRIHSEESFLREGDVFEANGEPRWYVRDSLSRGWDYTSINWRRAWTDNLVSLLETRHFLNSGPLQGREEEYNTWEDGGTQARPRNRYAGISLDLQYRFNASRCLLGTLPICFNKVQLTQETGYAALFENNTTTLELTTNFFGLPVQLWTRTGYNSDLVDYYNHSNSWGLGIELISR